MPELKPCPFCGKSVAVVSCLQDEGMCRNFEDEYACSGFERPMVDVGPDHTPCPRFVVCDVSKGGCGASTGWYANLDKLIAAWNRRVDDA